ncbi:fatty acid synthase subunit beta domain-containing protein [Nocardia sp. alder85J]|uniref:fatty acid synthase subunit beta domain-containing protein n=1 Tax=Nocardia sp. alder85J TaxID=2862949 RepID=UPI003A4D2D2E
MTINESAGTNAKVARGAGQSSNSGIKSSLLDRLLAGETYALAFGGQGAQWLRELEEIGRDSALEPELTALVNEAAALLEPVADQLLVVRPVGFDPVAWMLEDEIADTEAGEVSAAPSEQVLRSAAISMPGVFLTQVAALRALRLQGLDSEQHPPVAIVGHSQGLLAAAAAEANGERDVELLALAQLVGASASLVARRRGLIPVGDKSSMVAVSNVDPEQLRAVVAEVSVGVDPQAAAVVSIRNGRRRVVLSGTVAQLERVRQRCAEINAEQTRDRDAKKRGGAVFAPVFEDVEVEVAFHHPALADTVELVAGWARQCGLDTELAAKLAKAILVDPVDWVSIVDSTIEAGAHWILDLGPSDLLSRLTVGSLKGSGVGVVSAATRPGQRSLFTPGAAPEVAAPWTSFAPQPIRLPNGRIVVETSFTRLTGRSPILLAGMTPTTVDAKIVAAAANAGHWAELAGGGQVTEQIFADRVAELGTLLHPGRAVQFNSLFLDPYLWKLQLGGKRLVQKARAAGAPLDGVIVTAGIPELDEAVALIEELSEVGIAHVAFKPGTVAQIRAVLRIADAVPDYPVIMHIEGGRAGGHHSWEDLDDLLLETYAELRNRGNVVVCVGGGIGTPERATVYLTGEWSTAHGYPAMPLDGVLVGTAAMATLEATTAPEVKQLLVDTPGTPEWVGAGTASAGMASGRSQLGADIHEIDNAASRTGRLLDEVAGDGEAVAARRAEIIEALNRTAKPYFGDVATMTYRQWLDRYVELAAYLPHQQPRSADFGSDIGEAIADATRSVWLDITWRDRFAEMVRRTESRLNPADHGEIATLFEVDSAFEAPVEALAVLAERYPAIADTVLHPADVPFFVSLCKIPGKPVNFVPVVDGDVRRWWRSDSLWQAHDPRYSADGVCIIPGTVAVAGITRVDEPVGELLDRFEQATAYSLIRGGVTPMAVDGRRRAEVTHGALDIVLAAPDVQWAGRTTLNPVHRLGDLDRWVTDEKGAIHPPTGATLEPTTGPDTDNAYVELTVPLSARDAVRIRITVPASVYNGGAPVITEDDADAAMSALLGVAAGQALPEVKGSNGIPVAHATLAWTPDLIADHAGVTGSGLPAGLSTIGRTVPDVLVGACWPAVFAALGATRTAGDRSVIEGMLDLVHLDHRIELLAELPGEPAVLAVRAESAGVTDTDLGRVVEVRVTVGAMRDHGLEARPVANLVERFAIRGRNGAGLLADPPRAAGTVSEAAVDTPRRRRRDVVLSAPRAMAAFAAVSGDHNPIHTSDAAAKLAGLGSPIVHGMWLSAAAQHAVSAVDPSAALPPRTVTAWTTRFLGMVRPGAQIDVRVERIAVDTGTEIVEVSCRTGGDLVMTATGRLAAPKTVYAFPGQGIQTKGMGLDARSRSKAAKEVWDRADKHTREALGFSILAVVRDNPTYLKARGVEYRHPQGVLHLTQFTQVAMATLGVAQVAELREAGAFVEGAMLAGHSVGEYNALAAVAGVLPLEAVLEVVFQRGSAMHELVPRDAQGRSDYRMAAIRPSQVGLPDAEVVDFVAGVGQAAGEFLEVVNLNLRGSQYAIAGTVAGLEALEDEIERRRAEFGGKRAFVLVPGIDVPFHSTVLREGVPEFRTKLEELLPQDVHPEILAGRYIPNLVPRPFSLEREFIAEIADYVPSQPLRDVLADWDSWAARPTELCRVVLIELLAWQFASPVRWIETQDLLFGELDVERFVEIGLAATPTVANLASNTLKLPQFTTARVEVLNIEREAAVVFSTDTDPAPVDEPEEVVAETSSAPAAAAAPVAAAPVAASGGPRPDDISFTAADATRVLIALWTKLRPDQIGPVDTIEGLCDGVSSRRNQLLVDLGSELSLGAIDGAADADMGALAATVQRLARTYKPFGSVLSDAIGDHLRKVFGPSGKRPAAIADRVKKVWQLGDGWAHHVTAEVSLGTREGASVRGGDLGGLVSGAPADGGAVDAAIDAAVQAVAARRGISVALPAAGGGGGATVDAAALGEFTEQITGKDGVLATAARVVLEQLGLAEQVSAPESSDDSLVDLVSAELGSDWPRLVAPVFDAKKAVLVDDRWASAREDLARLWLGDDAEISDSAVDGFRGAGEAVAAQAGWWRERAMGEARSVLAGTYERIAAAAVDTAQPGIWSDEVAVITGASKGSIAAAVTGRLLGGGATVVVTTSKLDDNRLAFYKQLYRDNARHGAALWVLPANMASYQDIDALIEWVGTEQTDNAGGAKVLVKSALQPTLLLPFAAPRVAGDLSDAGARAEMEMRVLLWSVERLIGGLSKIGADHDVDAKLHVVLPGSPNRGMFGGDGAYGEAKAALDAVVVKWRAEKSWSRRVTLVHALIGWVRGTGLMGGNDPLVAAVEKAGVQTWSTVEMADELLKWAGERARRVTADGPQTIDLTGGLANAKLDLPALAKQREAELEAESAVAVQENRTIPALPAPPTQSSALPVPQWGTVTADLADMVVIVGAAELGPWGSSRTRFEFEVEDRLTAAGVLELAWTTGLVVWENEPKAGWYDVASGDYVDESELVDRYHDIVVERCGVRRYVNDGAMIENAAPLLTSVFLDKDLTFVVTSEAEARSFLAADPEHTVVAPVADSGDWQVTRKAGTEIRVPRRAKLSRTVGGQIPTGWDPTKYGISADMAGSIDRVALWNIVCTVDAFLSSGFTPAELMSWVHPALVANTQGTGMGGMSSMRSLYIDNLLGEPRANDILQEALPNVALAHVVQSYVGSYGGMIHPVAACATAAVSVEEGVDKIRLGKADVVVAGGYDDLGIEGIVGFGDMSATADSAAMSAKGISDRYFSRANDRRRGGFVESQGGGTILLARGDVALAAGLPVLGVVAYAQSFADGVHTSIPAPGLGALSAGRGGAESRLAAALRKLGVAPDEIAVVSKHDTSTAANDPNESELHERLADVLGRTGGAPLFVISQKSLTGHAKGGAAAFQLIGLCQVLEQGVIPPNRSLDCVDEKMQQYPHLVWPRQPLRFGDRFALKAGLVTSLGFGHVSGLLAVVHPQAFIEAIAPEQRDEYLRRAEQRQLDGRQRFAESMCGGAPLYERPADRRLGGDGTPAAKIRQLEADVLLSDQARLSADGVYIPTGCTTTPAPR